HSSGLQAHLPVVHGPSAQSASTAQSPPVSQGAQLPPQSTPVSRAFLRPSSQRAGTHFESSHAPLPQSSSLLQASPSGVPGGAPPSPALASGDSAGTHSRPETS